jgi:hypothetical protein
MLFTIVFMVVFIGFGVYLLYGAIAARIKVRKAINWPKVKGTILSSEVVEDRVRSTTGRAVIAYIPDIAYQYSVNLEKYSGTRVVFGSVNYSYILASQICARFAAGTQADVYYNPEKPTDAVLAPKSREGLRSVIPGIFFIFTGVVVGLVAIIYS